MFPFFCISGKAGIHHEFLLRLKSERPTVPQPEIRYDRAASPKTLPDPLQELLRIVHLSSNGNLNLNTGLDVDDDLLDGLGGGEQAVIGSVIVHHGDKYSARRRRTP